MASSAPHVLGVDPMHVESMAFAWLAYRFANKKAGNLRLLRELEASAS